LIKRTNWVKSKRVFLADIVATEENALENVNTLTEVTFVMKNGVIYKNN